MHPLRLVASLALAVSFAASSSAELYRCEGPDGNTIFTDQKGVCPEADAFEPKGVVLHAPTPTVSPPAAVRHERIVNDLNAEAGAEAWQEKKREAQARVAKIRERRERLKPYVTHCNRGGYIKTVDDAGIEQMVNCSELKKTFSTLDGEEADALAYLNEGLAEECRKAGCEPGWLR